MKLGFWIARNVLATLFLVAGLVMLVTPGQGVLMILASLWMADFPGKRKMEQRIISLPRVAKTINRLREKAGKPPLELPSD